MTLCTSCNSPIHIFHLSISSVCILLCPDSDPVHTYYVTPTHIITLTIILLPTLHLCSHQYYFDLYFTIKSHLHVGIQYVQISMLEYSLGGPNPTQQWWWGIAIVLNTG